MIHDISSDFLICFKLVRKSRPPLGRIDFDLVSAWLVLCVCQTCSFHGHILTLLVVLLEQMCCSFAWLQTLSVSHCGPVSVTCEIFFLGNKSFRLRSISPQVVSPKLLLQRIKHFCCCCCCCCCYKWAEISLFIVFGQNLVECMTSSFSQFAYFKNLNIFGTKRDI